MARAAVFLERNVVWRRVILFGAENFLGVSPEFDLHHDALCPLTNTLSGILVLHGATVTKIRQCRSHPVVKSR